MKSVLRPLLPRAFPFALCFSLLNLAFSIILPSGAHLQSLSATESAQLATACGRSAESFPFRGGRAHPWAVSFMTKGRNRLGGTIISPWHILTAAHAFLRFDTIAFGKCNVYGYRNFETIRHGWTIVYGDDCIWQQQHDYLCARPNLTQNRIRAIFVDDGFADGGPFSFPLVPNSLVPLLTRFPLFFGCVSGHDWAIVELEVPIAFSDRVLPICLPASPALQQISDGEVLTVTSWGRRDAFHKGDPLIREIPLRHDAGCKGRPWSDTMPTNVEDYLCAKALNPKDYHAARTCHGDSGSGMEWKRRRTVGIGTALPRQNATRQRAQIEPQLSPAAVLSSAPSSRSASDQLTNVHMVGNGSKVNGSLTQRIVTMPITGKRMPLRMKRRKPKIHSRNVLRTPLVIPELELMKKWRNSRRNDEKPSRELPSQGEDEAVKLLLLNDIGQSAEERREEVIGRTDRSEVITELIGVTSYGSRQCGSDELARFTRIAHYVKKVCALVGVCYQLAGNE
ncbi:hypothetical protein niasHT_005030 [Heterodera trifolii]|uniref:Peptidase S1 domain-containing protein n=1 Tax=Heterodera trifolii TaxID=157864 RepID=A0ABD2M3F3_9BILA